MPQCTATAKSTGQRCRRRAVTGYRVCQVHGAGSPGQGRPGGRPIVHGRYSKLLPYELVERYDVARTDPDLLALREEVALLDARTAEVLTGLSTGESLSAWERVRGGLELVQQGLAANNTAALQTGLQTIEEAVEDVHNQETIWAEVLSLIEQRRKLVESERRRLVELHQVITAERAMALIAAVADCVRRHVDDKQVMSAIAAEIRGLIAEPSGQSE